jgi:branched-chain amino acid transport system ATP-binding protein
MLEVQEIHTYYGDSYVLYGVTLRVGSGELVSLLGRNGVGKTTTLRSIIGFTPPRRGSVMLDGLAIQGFAPERIVQLGIGIVPQGRRVFADLTVWENLRIAARRKDDGWTIERIYNLFPRLRERSGINAGVLSGGEQQMLAIGRALMGNHRVILMDEPSEGLSPAVVAEVRDIILKLKQTGLSILLVEQNFALALSVADRVYVLNKGQVVFEGTPAALAADELVKARYLGV